MKRGQAHPARGGPAGALAEACLAIIDGAQQDSRVFAPLIMPGVIQVNEIAKAHEAGAKVSRPL